MMDTLMTVLFYAILACFAVTILAWCVSEWMKKWQAGVLVGAASALGVLLLLVQLVVLFVRGEGMTSAGLYSICGFVLALSTCYMHFRLMGTGVAPLAAIFILALESGTRFAPTLDALLPVVAKFDAPWVQQACVLAAVGIGLAISYGLLAGISARRQRNLEEETNELDKYVSNSMPKMVSHFGWWAIVALSFALGAYMLWCQTLYGVFWIWQPLMAVLAAVWLLLFLGKDVLKIR